MTPSPIRFALGLLSLAIAALAQPKAGVGHGIFVYDLTKAK